MSESPEAPAARPLLTVLRGDPTPEQLAALLAVVSSRATAAAAEDAAPPARSLWARGDGGSGPTSR